MYDTQFIYYFLCKRKFTVTNTIRFFEVLLVHHVVLDMNEQKKKSNHILKFLDKYRTQ